MEKHQKHKYHSNGLIAGRIANYKKYKCPAKCDLREIVIALQLHFRQPTNIKPHTSQTSAWCLRAFTQTHIAFRKHIITYEKTEYLHGAAESS